VVPTGRRGDSRTRPPVTHESDARRLTNRLRHNAAIARQVGNPSLAAYSDGYIGVALGRAGSPPRRRLHLIRVDGLVAFGAHLLAAEAYGEAVDAYREVVRTNELNAADECTIRPASKGRIRLTAGPRTRAANVLPRRFVLR
jgi:hypothetical protein